MADESEIFLSKLILHGESILAEIFRLASFIPKEFRDPSKSAKFRSIVGLDFKYLAKIEQIEKELEKDLRLQNHFYSTFSPVLIAFEQLFSSISEFVQTFTSYAQETADLEERTELESYCVYICGLLLIYLDTFVPGPIRERIYIAIYRKSDVRENAEFLVDFLKTNSNDTSMVSRIPLPQKFIRSCLYSIEMSESAESFLRIPKSNLIYVVLQFDRATLSTDSPRMTKIANSVYRECWVLNLGFGVIANVFDAWYPYKAAWNAINSTITQQIGSGIMEKHLKVLRDANFPQVLTEMVDFSEHLQNVSTANKSLRWLFLHSRPSNRFKALKERPSEEQLFQWLLDVSRCESALMNLYTTTVENRETEAKIVITKIRAHLKQLGDFFEHGFVKIGEAQKANFIGWIRNLTETVEKSKDSEGAETVRQIIRRIKQVGELLNLSTNAALRECLSNVDIHLRSLLSILSVSDSSEVLSKMDASFLWPLLPELIPRIQSNLVSTHNTDVVRNIFSKLSVSVYILKSRLSQFAEKDQAASRIVNTYSYTLEKYLREVLQSVPKHLFGIMYQVIVPALKRKFEPFIEKSELRELSEYVHNSKLVESTCLIANTSMGISRMMLTKVGTMEINPKELLEDGMIRQLYKEIKKVMKSPGASIEAIQKTGESVETMRSAFLYLCDYMNLDGERVWNVAIDDYFSRISEERAFAKSSGELEKNEIAELVVKTTSPRTTRYSQNNMCWDDVRSSKTVLSFNFFDRLEKMIPFHVLTSIETHLTVELENMVVEYTTSARRLGVSFNLQNALTHETAYDFFAGPVYEKLVKTIQPQSTALGTLLAQIGQFILLLRTVTNAKRMANRQKEDVIHRELSELSRALAADPSDLPAEMSTILKLMMQYSLYNPEKMIFKLKDEPSPIFMLALVQCVLPKIGDASFVCAQQLEVGVRFVLRQSRLFPYFRPILKEQLPESSVPKKRQSEVELFLRRLEQNL